MNIVVLTKSKISTDNLKNVDNTINIRLFNSTLQLCGYSPDVIIVDKNIELTEVDEDAINACIYDGIKPTGQLIKL